MRIVISSLLIFLLSASISVSAQAKHKNNELDGKIFHITLKMTDGQRKGWQWVTDDVSFKKGKLKSKVMSEREEFPAADCTTTVDSSSHEIIISFSASHKNTGVSNIKWEGTVTGNKIQGTAIWTNMQGVQTYSFKGTLQKEK